MFIVAIHILVGILVAAFLICGKRSVPYVELKPEKPPNGEISGSFPKINQNSATESMNRLVEFFIRRNTLCVVYSDANTGVFYSLVKRCG